MLSKLKPTHNINSDIIILGIDESDINSFGLLVWDERADVARAMVVQRYSDQV